MQLQQIRSRYIKSKEVSYCRVLCIIYVAMLTLREVSGCIIARIRNYVLYKAMPWFLKKRYRTREISLFFMLELGKKLIISSPLLVTMSEDSLVDQTKLISVLITLVLSSQNLSRKEMFCFGALHGCCWLNDLYYIINSLSLDSNINR